jgi:hypothetical protein
VRNTLSEIGTHTQVVHGQVSHCGSISFGGSDAFRATDAEPARIEITAWAKDAAEVDVSLHEGETFQIAGQTWRLDAIHDDGRGWYADLTRIA